jgi:hypothetical protein
MKRRRLTSPLQEEEKEAEEHELVKEVLRELPPKEKGVRDEWNQHVGWKRKEYVRKVAFRKDGQKILQGSEGKSHEAMGGLHPKKLMTLSQSKLIWGTSLFLMTFVVSKLLRKKTKGRIQ